MPLTIPDQFIATKVQVPNAMESIGNMLNTAGAMQNVQRGGIELQKAQQANQERIAVQQFMSNPDNFQTDGRIDMDKVNKGIPAIAPLTGAEHIGRLSTLSRAQTEADSAKQRLTQEQRGIVAGPMAVLGRAGVNDPNVYVNELEGLKKDNPNNSELHRLIDAKITAIKAMPPGSNLAKGAIVSSQSLLSPEGQQSQLSPKAGLANTGGAISETIETPAVGGNAPSISLTGRSQPLTLPPTAQRFNPKTNAPEYVGQPTGGGAVQSGPALGQSENASGLASNTQTDWRSIQESAKTASQDIGVLQEIKKYARGAVTGVESERRAYMSGLAGLIGMSPEQLSKTDTDLLAKNSNMLALAGGDTNLAKTLAESANPNIHMTQEAIEKAANQVIGQRQLSLARQKYLQPFINDPIAYSHAVMEFNQIADPRVLQLGSMSREEKAHMKAAMSPEEQQAFGDKIRAFYRLGILK